MFEGHIGLSRGLRVWDRWLKGYGFEHGFKLLLTFTPHLAINLHINKVCHNLIDAKNRYHIFSIIMSHIFFFLFFRATTNKKMKETVALELSFVNSNLQLLKEQLAELNSSVELYQNRNG